jgi:hypothetical protein
LPYMRNEALISHTTTENATTNLFLFQIAVLAGSGYMSLPWKTTEARKQKTYMRSIINNEEKTNVRYPNAWKSVRQECTTPGFICDRSATKVVLTHGNTIQTFEQ